MIATGARTLRRPLPTSAKEERDVRLDEARDGVRSFTPEDKNIKKAEARAYGITRGDERFGNCQVQG